MLMLRVRAQLGNQMFQYAAVRTSAESRGIGFAWREAITARDFIRRRLRRKTMTRPVVLPNFFQLGGDSRLSNAWRNLLWHLQGGPQAGTYTSRDRYAGAGLFSEAFDPNLAALPDGTEIIAWLQSERYFAGNRNAVRQWFQLRPAWACHLAALEKTLPGSADRRCCIHVRRTDFATANPDDPANGWILPFSYYRDAVASLPPGLAYVIVSDDPDWVDTHFNFLNPRFISRGQPSVIDMFLHGCCSYNIIANSTFSWWGAWLNPIPGKIVLCPNYFNGWKRRDWEPEAIRVEGWRYLDVAAPVQIP